jgi:hypothetical protein
MPAKRKFAAAPHQPLAQQSTKSEKDTKSEKELEADDASPGSQSVSEVPHSTTAGPSTDRASSVDDSDVEHLVTE